LQFTSVANQKLSESLVSVLFPFNVDAGNIATTLVKGDTDCEAMTRDLQAAVTEFNSALILLNASMTFQTVRMLGQLGHKVEEINKRVIGKPQSMGLTQGRT
jgi:hypothetical protein